MSTPSAIHPDSNDLDRLHPAVKREKADVAPGTDPAPMWVILIAFLVAIFGGSQLGNVGGFSFETSNPLAGARIPDPRPGLDGPGATLDPMQLAMKKGNATYALCGGCHQGNGMGLSGQFPALAGSEWVTGGTERSIRVVLNGLMGPIKVSGADFVSPNTMPPQGAVLSDADVANVLTFVRNSWGNKGSMVTKEMVQKVREAETARAAPWTMAELEKHATADVPGDAPAAAK